MFVSFDRSTERNNVGVRQFVLHHTQFFKSISSESKTSVTAESLHRHSCDSENHNLKWSQWSPPVQTPRIFHVPATEPVHRCRQNTVSVAKATDRLSQEHHSTSPRQRSNFFICSFLVLRYRKGALCHRRLIISIIQPIHKTDSSKPMNLYCGCVTLYRTLWDATVAMKCVVAKVVFSRYPRGVWIYSSTPCILP